jgi:hypothetical protein
LKVTFRFKIWALNNGKKIADPGSKIADPTIAVFFKKFSKEPTFSKYAD